MGGWIVEFFAAVVIRGDDSPIGIEQQGSDGHVAVNGRPSGLGERGLHSGFELGLVHVPLHYVAVGGIA